MQDNDEIKQDLQIEQGKEHLLPAVINRSAKDLVPFDPLQSYLQEIRKYRPLTREEEHDLAVRYKEHHDVEAAYKLVTGNLWLVVKIAKDYEQAAKNLLDLIQEGNIGLMEAVKNFDPYRGVRLPSYAVWWIKAYLVRYLIANWRIVKIGTTQAQRRLFFNLKREKERLEREGFLPTPKLLADSLNVKENEVVEMEQRLSAPDLSVDAPLQDDSDATILSTLPSDNISAEEALGNQQLSALINKAMQEFVETLNQNERTIYQKRLLAEEKSTLQDLSDELLISKERVRQIENRIKDKLKSFMLERFGSMIEDFKF